MPEAARENSCKWVSLTLQSGTPRCCDTVQVGQNVFVTWQLIATRRLFRTKTMIRHVHFIWSTKNRYNVLDATMTVKTSLVLQPQWTNNASECHAQFEQHRKVHLIDETYFSYVCLLVFHVDLCRRAVHDFDGTLHADTNDSLRHLVTAFLKWFAGREKCGPAGPKTPRDSSCSVHLFPPCCLQHGGLGPRR